VLRTLKYGLHGAVLAGLAAAPVIWTSTDKTVDLVVDGQASAVHTTAASVGDVLHDHGYRVSRHDLVAPSMSSHVKDGSRIVLRRGRLLHLSIDGARRDVWTTAPTVAQALAQLGYPTSDFVSVSRSRRLPLTPTDIAIRTPQPVTVVHDGQTQQVTTTETTVGGLLEQLGIPVGTADRVSPALTAPVVAGTTIHISRVGNKLVTEIQTVPFDTRRVKDSTLASGKTKVVSPGVDGKIRVTFSVVYVDGKAVDRTKVKSVTLTKPQTRVVKVGTKPAVSELAASAPNAAAPSPGSAKAIARQLLADRGWGADQYDCLVTLWNHESGWNVHAANPSGAYGIPQALPGSKMASAGPDWQNNATTQIKWGLGYIASRYGTPCGAWSTWQAHGGWY
jgi:uncharacterized protein YabE (DUF348 family)